MLLGVNKDILCPVFSIIAVNLYKVKGPMMTFRLI